MAVRVTDADEEQQDEVANQYRVRADEGGHVEKTCVSRQGNVDTKESTEPQCHVVHCVW